MSQTSADVSAETHTVSVELTDRVDELWFAEDFTVGEMIALQLGAETEVAEVIASEPAEGVIAVDISSFSRQDLGNSIGLPDSSSTGMQSSNLGVVWSIEAVETNSRASQGTRVAHVVCDCGALCDPGRGHSVHQANAECEVSADE